MKLRPSIGGSSCRSLMYEGIAAAGEAILVLRLPEERILLATDSARALLTPEAGEPVGRPLPEFLGAPFGEPAELLVRGHLNGFQLHRVRTAGPAADLEVRVRAVADRAGIEPVLALLSPAGDGAAEPDAGRPRPGVGWVDRQLLLRQVSDEAAGLLGGSAEELIGQSLLSLVAPEDLSALLFGLGQQATGREPVSLAIRLAGSRSARCQLVLAPLEPAPSCGFALSAAAAEDPLLLLRRFGRDIAAAAGARGRLTAAGQPLPELTGRELQIVSRLLAGDRVPAISRQLYLAQSTVRNHLSAVFAKLGVRSQQELIVLLRKAQSRRD